MFFHPIFVPKWRSLGTLPAEHIILLLGVELITTGLSGEEHRLHLQLVSGLQLQVSAREAELRTGTYSGKAKDTFAQ